jgi:uncharacterized protein with LGFP repeats
MGRKLARLVALAPLGVLAWAAAPALSLSQYVPEPVEFDQPLPALERVRIASGSHSTHPGEGPIRFRSGTIEAPKRFDAVGVGGEMRPLEIRFRESGEEWSEWIEAVDGNPVWSGGAEELELRSRGWRPEGSLHYVNVSGDATAGDQVLTAIRGAVNAAVLDVASATPALAAAPRPNIRSRARWDPGNDCRPRTRPAYGEVRAATVHHTVNANDYSRGETASMLRAICLFHRNGNGWNDIGYNAIVDRFGRLWTGRDGGVGRPVVGAHNQGFNSTTAGIASLGTHSDVSVSRQGLQGLVGYLAWKLDRHGIPATGRVRVVAAGGDASRYDSGERVYIKRIIGHRRTGLTSCPGDALDEDLGKIRRRTQRRIDAHPDEEEPPPPEDGGVPD